jgi:hypothetical protein
MTTFVGVLQTLLTLQQVRNTAFSHVFIQSVGRPIFNETPFFRHQNNMINHDNNLAAFA